ncbi:MAG: hypothetical protein IJ302_04460 [Clostridia bacterium]|nr:hypothetical protein [Clostridia bacterium]
MKTGQIAKRLTSLLLMLTMLFSMPLYLCAADSHPGRVNDTTHAVYPTAPYTYMTHPSPDGTYTLRVRINVQEGVQYYDEFAVLVSETGEVIRAVDMHREYGCQYGVDAYEAIWSPEGRFVALDMSESSTLFWSVKFLDAEEGDLWVPSSSLDLYEYWIWPQDPSLPHPDKVRNSPLMLEKWMSRGRASLITELDLGDGQRLWGRYIFDAVNETITSRSWGDALDLDSAANPIWSRALGEGAPAYNSGDFTVASPDGMSFVTLHAAEHKTDPETWSPLYSGFTVKRLTEMNTYELLYTVDFASYPYDRTRMLENYSDVCVKWAPDSSYAIVESADPGAKVFVCDMITGEYRLMRNLDALYETLMGKDAPESFPDSAHLFVEGFSVSGEALWAADFGDEWVRWIDDPGTYGSAGTTEIVDSGTAEDRSWVYTPDTAPTVRDGFTGFTAVSKTHHSGLDGLFSVGDGYKYVHMMPSADAYSEYVVDAKTERDGLFGKYDIVWSEEGCWVLDDEENTVYAGTGVIESCGAFALACNTETHNGAYNRIRLYDSEFALLLDYVNEKGVAVQDDGAVYAAYTRDGTTYLAYVSADGKVTELGIYSGNLSEYR